MKTISLSLALLMAVGTNQTLAQGWAVDLPRLTFTSTSDTGPTAPIVPVPSGRKGQD